MTETADLARIKRNVQKMVEMGAPEADIDGYIDSEGVTLDQVRAFQPQQAEAAPQEPEQAQMEAPRTGAVEAANVGVLQSITSGFGDEIMSAGMTPFEMIRGAWNGEDSGKGLVDRVGSAYDRALERERAYQGQAREDHPIATTVGDVAGGVATAGTLAKGGATLLKGAAPTYRSMMGRGAAEGAAYGAAYGFGDGQGLEDRLSRSGMGAAGGALIGAGAGALGARTAQNAGRQAVPTTDQLRNQADDLYRQAEQAGLVVRPQSFGSAVDDIATVARDAGLDRTIHPKASAALNRLVEAKDAGAQPSLKDIDILRRVLGGAAKSNEKDERRIATLMIDKLDDWLTNLKPADVASGDAKQAANAILKARDLWSRMRKGEIIENLFERAGLNAPNFSGSGMENALRTEFRNLAKNQKLLRGFTTAEREAIKKVAKGGNMENLLRMVGKFAPTGVVSAGISGGIGYTALGPIGGVALPMLGFAARRGATRMTTNNAQRVADMVRSGGVLPQQQLTGLREALLQIGVDVGGQQIGGHYGPGLLQQVPVR